MKVGSGVVADAVEESESREPDQAHAGQCDLDLETELVGDDFVI